MRKLQLSKQKNKIDNKLLFLTFILVGLGLLVIADASAPQALSVFDDKFFFVKQQAVWAVLGVFALVVSSQVKYTVWEKFALPLFIFSVLLLILVLIPPLGTKVLGARRWLVLGPISLQPSEIIKLTIAIYFAKLASNKKSLLSYLVPLGLICALIMLQPDLGTTMIVAGVGIVQMFVAGISLLYLGGVLLAGGVASFLLIILSDYRKDRLMTFIQATSDPLGKSYHIRQVLFGLGLGGFFGVGLGQSRQKYLFLPEAATDSVFAIVAEEVGFLGASIMILLLAYFIYRALRIASAAPDTFAKILSIGLVTWVGGQTFLNIASMVALVPLTGIPLPFFSYGGSALTMVMLATGILLNISKYGKKTVKGRRN